MPYFVHDKSKDKLTILFFTKAANMDIKREQIYRAMVENDCMQYFAFETAMHELEEDGFIAAIPRTFGQGYRVTGRGTESLTMFENSLPHSYRQKLDAYADANREAMRQESQLVSSMEQQPDGGYVVELKAQEDRAVVLTIRMRVASREMAQKIRGNWAAASDTIYSVMLRELLKAPEPEQPEPEQPEQP